MFFRQKFKAVFLVLFTVFLFVLDRLLKSYALSNRSLDKSILGDIFSFSYAPNYYIAFSIPLGGVLLNVLIVAILLILFVVFCGELRRKSYEVSLYLLILQFGALSNLIDRLKHGFVVDYLDLEYFTVFNLADCMIVFATGFLALNLLRKDRNKI